MSLSRAVREHQKRAEVIKEENEKNKKAAILTIQSTSASLVQAVNSGVASVFHQQSLLESESRALQQNTNRLVKSAQQWANLFTQLNESLKELGDIENWSRAIAKDVMQIQEHLQIAAGGAALPAAAASSKS